MRTIAEYSTILLLLFLFIAPLACDDDDDDDTKRDEDDDDDNDDDFNDDPGAFRLISTAFKQNEIIPDQYTCQNDNPADGFSPPLAWENAPSGALAFALTMRDPDSPDGDTKHWGLINVPSDLNNLAEAISPGGDLPEGAWETLNFRETIGYAGPCPPASDDPHHYVLTITALGAEIPNPGGEVPLDDVLGAIEATTLDTATLTGLFGND